MPANAIAPRANTTQQVDFERHTITFATGNGFFGSIPVGCVITRVSLSVSAAFNGGTNPITVGVTPGGSELMAAGDSTPGTPGHYPATRGLGNILTQVSPGATAFGDPEGGIPLYCNYAPTGAAPTAGSAMITVDFIPLPYS